MSTHDDIHTDVNTSRGRAARAGVWLAAAGATLVLTTACGGSNSGTSPATTATSMPVSTQSATDTTTTNTATSTVTSTATTTNTATSTVTSTATTTNTATATASATTTKTTSPGRSSSPSGHVVVDSPARYMVGDRLVFTSPTGALHCSLDSQGIGCQSTEKVANMPQCNDPQGSKAPMVTFQDAGAMTMCTNQGVFIAPGAKALPYGHSVTGKGVTCTSQRTGIYCLDSLTNWSLFASREYFGSGR